MSIVPRLLNTHKASHEAFCTFQPTCHGMSCNPVGALPSLPRLNLQCGHRCLFASLTLHSGNCSLALIALLYNEKKKINSKKTHR